MRQSVLALDRCLLDNERSSRRIRDWTTHRSNCPHHSVGLYLLVSPLGDYWRRLEDCGLHRTVWSSGAMPRGGDAPPRTAPRTDTILHFLPRYGSVWKKPLRG